ncbi:MAG TPA: copper resistance protein CopC [Alphaproteobacteria bacterium]|nr:copper resistance protein CopC [Alphaproteobacteria bacterium]
MKRARCLLFGLAAMLAWGPVRPASAHAFLDRAEPAVGSTVAAAPKSVRLWFSERLEPAFSSVHVENAAGEDVDRGDLAVDPHDRTVIGVSLKPIPPGTYKVRWRAVSVDGHATEGDFVFTVGR